MNNQNSEKENPSPIYFSPTGGDLPPIEIEDRSLGVLIRLLNDTFNALSVFIRGKVKCSEHWVIQVIEEHKENLINIIKSKRTMANTGTMEYNEVQEDMANKTNDMVNHPKHYTTGGPIITIKCKCGEVIKKALECIEVIRDMPSWKGNAIKYLWRCGLKKEEGMSDVDKEIQDLEKAIWYINDRIKQLKEESLCT